MRDKKGQPFPLIIIAIVLGWTVFKQFDAENLKFKEPVLAIVYLATFILAVYLIVKSNRGK